MPPGSSNTCSRLPLPSIWTHSTFPTLISRSTIPMAASAPSALLHIREQNCIFLRAAQQQWQFGHLCPWLCWRDLCSCPIRPEPHAHRPAVLHLIMRAPVKATVSTDGGRPDLGPDPMGRSRIQQPCTSTAAGSHREEQGPRASAWMLRGQGSLLLQGCPGAKSGEFCKGTVYPILASDGASESSCRNPRDATCPARQGGTFCAAGYSPASAVHRCVCWMIRGYALGTWLPDL